MHACPPLPSLNRGVTHLAAGEPSNICADTAPPSGSRAGICRTTVTGAWPAERPVSPGTRQPPAPRAGTPLRRPHTAPSPGTTPHIEDRWSTHDELQRSRWGREGKGRWVLRLATHLRERKEVEGDVFKIDKERWRCQRSEFFKASCYKNPTLHIKCTW